MKNCEYKHHSIKGNDKANARAFIEYLECLADNDNCDEEQVNRQHKPDRGTLAQIRRTLGKPLDQAFGAFPYVVKWTQELNNDWYEECYYLVAALYASEYQALGCSLHHQQDLKDYQRNLGASFLALDKRQREDSNNDERSKSLERRFTNLLMSRKQDLPQRLRHAISLLAAKKIPIDWVQLLLDLCWWDQRQKAYANPLPSTQRRWAKAFWRIDSSGDYPAVSEADNANANDDDDNDNNPTSEDNEL